MGKQLRLVRSRSMNNEEQQEVKRYFGLVEVLSLACLLGARSASQRAAKRFLSWSACAAEGSIQYPYE
jgi:hypothetical protein